MDHHQRSLLKEKKQTRKHRYRLFRLFESSNLFHRISAVEIFCFLILLLILIYLI